jgi:hypothetical protein
VLINDTLGVMAAGRYMHPDAMIGIILGTGRVCRCKNISWKKHAALAHGLACCFCTLCYSQLQAPMPAMWRQHPV